MLIWFLVWKENLKAIHHLASSKSSTLSIESKFLNQYMYNADKYDKILTEMFKLGLYIRGWRIDNNSAYPIKKESILNYNSHQDEINDNVLKTIERLEELKDETFCILPIVSYSKDKKIFNYEKELIWDIVVQLKEIKSVVFLDLIAKSINLLNSIYHYMFLIQRTD